MDSSQTSTRLVLLTGAAGRIGTAFFTATQDRYRFRLADISDVHADYPHESVPTEVSDFEACRRACQHVDTVIHLAADPSPEADFDNSLLENNIKGTYNMFRAASEAGCRRMVFASSVHAVGGYSSGNPVTESQPVWPVNMYGVSKCFGEATGRKFASSEGLSNVALRIGAYEAPWIAKSATEQNLSMYLSPRDLNQLMVRCIETDNIEFAILHAISDNRIKRLSIDAARELVGYAPEDDGFEKYRVIPG